MGNNAEQMLKEFILEDECLSDISVKANEINIFEVLKAEKSELRHSNMLAWLLDPSENHGLGASFLREFIKAVIRSGYNDYDANYEYAGEDISGHIVEWTLTDFDTVIVNREEKVSSGRADIIVRASANNKSYLLVIENKVGSVESVDQTKKYYAEFSNENADYSVYVYLTPSGEMPRDNHWCIVTYKDVISALDNARSYHALSDKVNLLLDDYTKSVKKHIIGDEEIIRLCDAIYRDNKDAVDYILKNGDDPKSLAAAIMNKHRSAFELLKDNVEGIDAKIGRYIREFLKDEARKGTIQIDERLLNQKVYIYFYTKKMTELFGKLEDTSSPWKTDQKYCYQFCNRPDSVTFNLELGGGDFLCENNLFEKELRIAEKYKARMTLDYKFKRCDILGKRISRLNSKNLSEKTDEEIKEAVYKYVQIIIEKLPDKENEIEKLFNLE